MISDINYLPGFESFNEDGKSLKWENHDLCKLHDDFTNRVVKSKYTEP